MGQDGNSDFFRRNLRRALFRFPALLRWCGQIGEVAREVAWARACSRVLKTLPPEGPYPVLHGPFQGLLYPSLQAVGSAALPKIIGSYEAELHTLLERLCTCSYTTVIDIGSAEGYYAVGLALRLKQAHVFAFEGNPQGRTLCGEMARINEVSDRVELFGWCDRASLAQLVETRKTGLIVCDCEGGEYDLLDPRQIPALDHFDILMELHEIHPDGPTAAQIFRERFHLSHNAEFINLRSRKSLQHLSPLTLTESEARFVTDEGRGGSGGWLFLQKK
ncbi:MAG TPA: hypothetical protein PLA90_03630 [Candidatus Sumerlaeota bacterium]|nr:hypothetical protein [Candidatus Sumerlaeota bacterium]HPS00609.1 hypothetical protein [Candidatus Sumerlaeota bacterium]